MLLEELKLTLLVLDEANDRAEITRQKVKKFFEKDLNGDVNISTNISLLSSDSNRMVSSLDFVEDCAIRRLTCGLSSTRPKSYWREAIRKTLELLDPDGKSPNMTGIKTLLSVEPDSDHLVFDKFILKGWSQLDVTTTNDRSVQFELGSIVGLEYFVSHFSSQNERNKLKDINATFHNSE